MEVKFRITREEYNEWTIYKRSNVFPTTILKGTMDRDNDIKISKKDSALHGFCVFKDGYILVNTKGKTINLWK